MASNYSCSGPSNEPNQPLGFLLCLLIIAYIYYVHSTPQEQARPAQERTQDPIDISPVTSPLQPPSDAARLAAIGTPYDKGYYDGIKAYLHFDIADIRRVKKVIEKRDQESQKREETMKKKLADFEKECKQMEKAMKTWREEYVEALWEAKEKGEKGLLTGWLRFGSPRASTTMVKREVKSSAAKVGNGRAKEKLEVRYEDEKKG